MDNLILLIDYNKIQALNRVGDTLPLDDLSSKFIAFNWECIEVKNGHSFEELIPIISNNNKINCPKAIIVHTIKGKGIKDFENDATWHARKIKGEELETGRKELGIV